MTGDIGAAGDLITGALWGRVTEPHAGEGSDGHGSAHGPTLCLNCGTRLIGAHCHACGQSAHVHKSVAAIGHEIAHGVFHVEGKIWRTAPMLVWRPGELTRRYIDGERARFVSPLALFLFTVFLLFAAISWVGGDMAGNLTHPRTKAQKAEFARALVKTRAELAQAQTARDAAAKAHTPTDELDARVAALRTTVGALETTQGGTVGIQESDIPKAQGATGWAAFKHSAVEKFRNNPGLMIYKLQSSAYKYSWLLIPLSTPVVALLFLWRRRFGLYDHAIFVTYSLSFMMLLVTALTLAGAAGLPAGWIVLAIFVAPPLHMYKQLRATYQLRRFSAAWRMVVLIWFAFAVLSAFTFLLLLHGLSE